MFWYLEAMKKYAVFGGRARRREYWLFFLFSTVILLAIATAAILAGLDAETGIGQGGFAVLYCLTVGIPGLSVSVRRLHDTDRSGWWLWIAFIPLIGEIILLVFFVQDSQPGTNRYGPNPKALP